MWYQDSPTEFGGTWEPPEASHAGVDFGTGWGDTFQNIAKLGAATWAQQTLMQQNQQGQRYMEGQRVVYANGQAVGINSGTLLLLAGAAVVVMMMKD